MMTAKPVGMVAFQWQGDEPGKDWPAWVLAAADEDDRHGRAGFPEMWPLAVLSVVNQNTPAVKMSLKRPSVEGFLYARPGNWIVRTDVGHWDVYTDEIFRATFGEEWPVTK